MALIEDIKYFYLNNKNKGKDIVDVMHNSAICVASNLGEVVPKRNKNRITLRYII